jgi:sulfur-carrier protein
MTPVRVLLPQLLRSMVHVKDEVVIEVEGPVTQRSVLDAVEAQFPVLQGMIRDHATGVRKPFLRFFACQEDWSLESPDAELPSAVAEGREAFLIITAIAGG